MMWILEFLGKTPAMVFFTVFLMLLGSGAYSYGAFLVGQRQYPVHYKHVVFGYIGFMVFILVVSRGLISLCGG